MISGKKYLRLGMQPVARRRTRLGNRVDPWWTQVRLVVRWMKALLPGATAVGGGDVRAPIGERKRSWPRAPVAGRLNVDEWRERFEIRRLDCRKARIQDVAAELNALSAMSTLVTFVHAHVNVDEVLSLLRWDAAFTLGCCLPGKQLTLGHEVRAGGVDMSVLSPARQYQVLVPRNS